MLGRFDEARSVQAAQHDRACEVGVEGAIAHSCSSGAEIEWLAGEPEAAYEWGREACERMEAMGQRSWLSTFAAELGHPLCALGRYDEADRWAEKGKALGADDDIATNIHWGRVRAKVLSWQGRLPEAEEHALNAVALARTTDWISGQGDALLDLAEVLDLAGRPDEAAAALREAIERFELKGNLAMAARARARLELVAAP